MIPKNIITVSLFPLNSNGKTDRKAVMQNYLQNLQGAHQQERAKSQT
jgi:hypothetical protein